MDSSNKDCKKVHVDIYANYPKRSSWIPIEEDVGVKTFSLLGAHEFSDASTIDHYVGFTLSRLIYSR
ncbi:2248_t:CDS:2 [Ambispora leptoticha]|uniref:2248_t:CDS:1 n=1 Tax=Ambispora leptoticha TaxID=144679 RepID=A0A9N9B1V7_9GLOM|nr:2248_t:CDS:2 [Ambispora leptoticha]